MPRSLLLIPCLLLVSCQATRPDEAPAAPMQAPPGQPVGEASIVVRPLQHASAGDVAGLLRMVLQVGTAPADAEFVAAADLRTNSLVLRAPADQMKRALELVGALDVAVTQQTSSRAPESSFEVLVMKFATARDVAGLLHDLLPNGRGPGGVRHYAIEADERTNSLLIQAPPDHMNHIKHLISRLDVEAGKG